MKQVCLISTWPVLEILCLRPHLKILHCKSRTICCSPPTHFVLAELLELKWWIINAEGTSAPTSGVSIFHEDKSRAAALFEEEAAGPKEVITWPCFVASRCWLRPARLSWPGPAHPDGGVDAPAPSADPAAHLRLPAGAARRGRARTERRGAAAACPRRRPQSEHAQRSQLRLPEYVLAKRFPSPAP